MAKPEPSKCSRCEDRLVTVRDVEAVIREHLAQLDKLWPETERYGCRKIHVVELLDGIKLKLYMRAEKNAQSNLSAFELAARRVTGYDPNLGKNMGQTAEQIPPSSAQQHADHMARVKRGQT